MAAVGICTRYSHHEATYAAIRLADWASTNRHRVSLFTPSSPPQPIGNPWDRKLCTPKLLPFSDWAYRQDILVWSHIPHYDQLCWASGTGKKTILLLLWQELAHDDFETLIDFDIVICPTQASYKLLQSWGLRNVKYISWDVGCPPFARSPRQILLPRICLPLWDGNCRRTEMTALTVLDRALSRHKHCEATVIFNTSTLRSVAKRKLRTMAKTYRSRLVTVKGLSPGLRPTTLQQHDLVYWPTHWESFCYTGRMAAAVGTPVISFDFPPVNEVLSTQSNVLVPCSVDVNDMEVPHALPDYTLMDRALADLLSQPERLAALQSVGSTDYISKQALAFHRKLSSLIK